MERVKNIGVNFYKNLKILGFKKEDDVLFLTKGNSHIPYEIRFY